MSLVHLAMGILCLGILWLNTLLIAAAALKQRAALGERLAALQPVEGEIVRGDGPEGALATQILHQVGRAITTAGPERLLLTQARREVVRHGGLVKTAAGERALPADSRFELWLEDEGARDETDFARAFAAASTQKGLATATRAHLGAGRKVWLDRDVLVSALEPRAEIVRRRTGLLAFALASVLLCAGVTAIALVPPVFGTISTIGGALGLLFFVLVQPAGVRVRNWARLPHERLHTSIWQRP